MRFLPDDEALKTLSLFEGASETNRISKSSLKNWVVRSLDDELSYSLSHCDINGMRKHLFHR